MNKKRMFLSTVTVVFLLAALIVGLNFIDDPLYPEIAALIDSPAPVTPQAVTGLKYFLGIGAPEAQDPSLVGAAIYLDLQAGAPLPPDSTAWVQGVNDSVNRAVVQGKYLTRQQVHEKHDAIDSVLAVNKAILSRYDRLLELGSLGVDYKMGFRGGPSPTGLLALSRLKLLQINFAIAQGQTTTALADLKRIFEFHRASVSGHMTMLDLAIRMAILHGARTMAKDAAADAPEFARLLQKEPGAFTADFSPDIVRLAEKGEFEEASTVLSLPSSFAKALETQSELLAWAATRTPNRTLNYIYKIGQNPDYIPTHFPYFASANLARVFALPLNGTRKKILLRIEELKTPL
jgi:hypothetical protein